MAEDVAYIAGGEEQKPTAAAIVEEDDRSESRIGPPDGRDMPGAAAGGESNPGQQGGKRYHEDKFECDLQSAQLILPRIRFLGWFLHISGIQDFLTGACGEGDGRGKAWIGFKS